MDQAQHYDTILDDYEKHYYDPQSMQYRRRYIYPNLFHGIDLGGKRVIELACGSGFNTQETLKIFPDAAIIGLDISPLSCAAYNRNTGCEAMVYDLTDPAAVAVEPADCAFVVGGLHHCIKDLPSTFANLARLIKLGGHLLMVEPNAGFFLNAVRTYWYGRDRWFQEQDEAPLNHAHLTDLASGLFVPEQVLYLGGPAYFLILNSLILRLPVAAKKVIAPVAFAADTVYNCLPGQAPYPMFIAQWRRTS